MAKDLNDVADLLNILHRDAPLLSLETFENTLSHLGHIPGSAILVAESAGKVVGMVTLLVMPNLSYGGRPFAVLENVVIHSDCRGQGYGKELLSAAIGHAWLADCYKVMLLTGSSKPEVLGFYEGLGFERSKTGFEIRRVPRRVE